MLRRLPSSCCSATFLHMLPIKCQGGELAAGTPANPVIIIGGAPVTHKSVNASTVAWTWIGLQESVAKWPLINCVKCNRLALELKCQLDRWMDLFESFWNHIHFGAQGQLNLLDGQCAGAWLIAAFWPNTDALCCTRFHIVNNMLCICLFVLRFLRGLFCGSFFL